MTLLKACMAVFITVIFSPHAQAELLNYNLVFEGGSPSPTAGSFSWDTDQKRFTEFKVEWNGAVIDALRSANGPVTQSHPSDPNHHTFSNADLYRALTKGWTLPNGRLLEKKWAVYAPNPQGNKFTSSLSIQLFSDNQGIVTGGDHPDPTYKAKHTLGTFTVTREGSTKPLGERRKKHIKDTRDSTGWLKYKLLFEGGESTPEFGYFAWHPTQKRFMDFRVRWQGLDIDMLRSANSPVTQGRRDDENFIMFTREVLFKTLTEGMTLADGRVLEKNWSSNPPNPPGNVFTSSLSLRQFSNNRGVVTGGSHPYPEFIARRSSGTFTVQQAGPGDEMADPIEGDEVSEEEEALDKTGEPKKPVTPNEDHPELPRPEPTGPRRQILID